jgi:sulfoxide reductase heme-binding subunit YedZ
MKPAKGAGASPGPSPRAAARLLALGALLVSLLAVGAYLAQPGVEGVRMLIRATARSSLVFFLMAYTASALASLWPGASSRWLRQHRRQWGLLLVFSHTVHAGGIVALGLLADPALFASLTPLGNRISGGIAYVWLWLMGATSFDRSAAWLGRRRWALLHTWGSHYLWLSFLVANGKRIPVDVAYVWPTLLLVAAMGLRLWARRVR